MGIHICTGESLVAGGFEHVGYCPICCTDTNVQVAGYAGSMCRGCGSYSTTEWCNGIVHARRMLLNLTTREIAEKYGVTRKTINNYESVWPSRKYWEWTKELVIAAYQSKGEE